MCLFLIIIINFQLNLPNYNNPSLLCYCWSVSQLSPAGGRNTTCPGHIAASSWWLLECIPAVTSWRQEYALERSPVHDRTLNDTHDLDFGQKLEEPEHTQAHGEHENSATVLQGDWASLRKQLNLVAIYCGSNVFNCVSTNLDRCWIRQQKVKIKNKRNKTTK